MAIRTIRLEEDPILRKISKEVDIIDDKIKILLDDMIDTMHANNGVGLSAVQVGILKRVIVADLYDGSKPLKLINPVILSQKGSEEMVEGCLSFPNKFATVVRPTKVVAEGLDENGKKVKINAEGLLAQIICHEVDHLNGILFEDLMLPDTLHYVEPEK